MDHAMGTFVKINRACVASTNFSIEYVYIGCLVLNTFSSGKVLLRQVQSGVSAS